MPWRVKQSNPSTRKGKKRQQTTRQKDKEHQNVTSVKASDPTDVHVTNQEKTAQLENHDTTTIHLKTG